MTTSLNDIKEITKLLFDSVSIKPLKGVPGLIQHPFTDTVFVPTFKKEEKNPFGMVNILENKTAYKEWRERVFKEIDKADKFIKIYMMVRDPWKLTLLKFCKEYMSVKLFSEYLADAWVASENPNGDSNCSVEELIEWFRCCRKDKLMQKKDLEIFEALPEEFEVYRGVSVGRNPRGLSWTRNLKKAQWFAHRFDGGGKKGYIQKALIKKENALAYFNTRNEDEVVVDSVAIKKNIEKVRDL